MTSRLDPAALSPHYTAFLKPSRVLLTGHSHQAWPDVARAAQLEAFDDAALHVDDKWSRAFEAAQAVQRAVARESVCAPDQVALGANTHELVVRFLSALPLRARPRLVSTAGEFHSIYRQLRRLSEEGVEVVLVAPLPAETLAERLAAAITDATAAVLVSSVLFETSSRVPHLATLAERCRARGVELLVDTYHQFMMAPLGLAELGPVWAVGGGYKYAQWGEGNCWMVVPSGCTLRPVFTGWFADFGHLAETRRAAPVTYGATLGERFAGATYDPTSHYRARAVDAFFTAHAIDSARLEATYAAQTQRLYEGLIARGLTVVTPSEPRARGGFLAVALDDAVEVSARLKALGVFTDARGTRLRFGPAPYLTDDALDAGLSALDRVLPKA
ncbi:MAG: kynureninase [Myxococcales bacterium]|nr:kynureninase [Myxococcales bacterium]